jgi:RimJ/RimL family protein N-acetyltransferase
VLFEALEESRPELDRWLNWPSTLTTIADVEQFCVMSRAKWDQRTELWYGIFLGTEGLMLGATGLHTINWEWRSFEVGYWLRTSEVGYGYAQEAVDALVRTAFRDLHARRVELHCDPANERSRHVAERLGFVLERRLRKATRTPAGLPRDTLVYALVDDDM